MLPAPRPPSSYLDRPSLPRRLAALLVALGMSGLIVLMLLRLGAFSGGPASRDTSPIVVQLLNHAEKAQKAQKETKAEPVRPRPKAPIPPPPISLPKTSRLNILTLSHEDFAASDISRFPKKSADAAANAQAASSEGDDPSVGQGPNGEKLYNAEWYREPSHAEMATYLPSSMSEPGWAMIACRTIEHYHVDDCEELTESPPGSGLARALRLAAWQFLVRPPRAGGKAMVGSWVRIRFDFTEEKRAN